MHLFLEQLSIIRLKSHVLIGYFGLVISSSNCEFVHVQYF